MRKFFLSFARGEVFVEAAYGREGSVSVADCFGYDDSVRGFALYNSLSLAAHMRGERRGAGQSRLWFRLGRGGLFESYGDCYCGQLYRQESFSSACTRQPPAWAWTRPPEDLLVRERVISISQVCIPRRHLPPPRHRHRGPHHPHRPHPRSRPRQSHQDPARIAEPRR